MPLLLIDGARRPRRLQASTSATIAVILSAATSFAHHELIAGDLRRRRQPDLGDLFVLSIPHNPSLHNNRRRAVGSSRVSTSSRPLSDRPAARSSADAPPNFFGGQLA
jgi:hypothetical protein